MRKTFDGHEGWGRPLADPSHNGDVTSYAFWSVRVDARIALAVWWAAAVAWIFFSLFRLDSDGVVFAFVGVVVGVVVFFTAHLSTLRRETETGALTVSLGETALLPAVPAMFIVYALGRAGGSGSLGWAVGAAAGAGVGLAIGASLAMLRVPR